MAFDFGAGYRVEFEYAALPRGPMDLHAEHPSFPRRREVFALLPGLGLVGMASGGPAPKFVVNVVFQLAKGPLGRSVAVVIGPAAQKRVELSQERFLSLSQGGLNRPADFLPQDLHFALCGDSQQFVPMFAHGVPQKVEALLDVGDDGLLL